MQGQEDRFSEVQADLKGMAWAAIFPPTSVHQAELPRPRPWKVPASGRLRSRTPGQSHLFHYNLDLLQHSMGLASTNQPIALKRKRISWKVCDRICAHCYSLTWHAPSGAVEAKATRGWL